MWLHCAHLHPSRCQHSQAGSGSGDLAQQVASFNSASPGRTLCVIHAGGNDIANHLSIDPLGFLMRLLCNLLVWAPCQAVLGLGLFVLGLATSTQSKYANGTVLQVGPWVLPVQLLMLFLTLRGLIVHSRPVQSGLVVESMSNNIEAALEGLHREGCRKFLVAGVPVHPSVPWIKAIIPCRCPALVSVVGSLVKAPTPHPLPSNPTNDHEHPHPHTHTYTSP